MSNFGFQSQILTGAARRAQKREHNPAAFTRAEALSVIASTDDVEVIEKFSIHQNKHVKRAVAHKTALIKSGARDFKRFAVNAWTAEMAQEVLALMAARNLSAEQAAEAIGCKPRRIKDWQRKLAA